MALKLDAVSPQGFNAVDAYHRVNGVSLIAKNRINFLIESFKDNNASIAFASEQYSCLYDLNGSNPIAQAYNHLKTLPEFSGAKDC
jgi:hypothetical protein